MTTLVSETALIFGRYARQTLRSRTQMLFGTLMPLLYLVFFGPLLKDLPLGYPGASSWQVLVPGLLLQLSLFGAAFCGFGVIIEKQHGILERMRVTPVSRLALFSGRVLRDAALFVFQAAVLTLAAVAMGLRAPLAGILVGFAFVGALSAALASLSYALAMKAPTPHTFGPIVNAVTMPTMLLSGLVLPMALAPGWLDALSHVMPLRYLVDAMRAAFTGVYAGSSMLWGAVAAAVLLVVSVTLGCRVFTRAGA